MRDMRSAYKFSIGKPEWKRPLERIVCKWIDDIGKDLTEIKWEIVDWIHVAPDKDQ
jgi:hypothetical protein